MSEEGQAQGPEEQADGKDRKAAQGKKRILVIAAIALLAVAAVAFWYVNFKVPHDAAVKAFDEVTVGLSQRNQELDDAVASLQGVVDSGEQPLDQSTLDEARSAIQSATAAKVEAPQMPSDTEQIKAAAEEVSSLGDYASPLESLRTAQKNLESSIAQMKLVTNPSGDSVVQRLTSLANVTGAEAVSEDNDPNGMLGKAGSYTATVYFSSDLVDQSKVYPSTGYTPIVAAGTDGGGAVEVYATTEDAQKRNDYLAAFDGSILASGSHKVVGTCVVRTSNLLTASNQQALEAAVIDGLTKLD